MIIYTFLLYQLITHWRFCVYLRDVSCADCGKSTTLDNE